MATWTKREWADKTLMYMGVVGSGETPSAEDSSSMETYVQSAYDELQTFGLVPFLISAVPSWAWSSLRKYVAAEAGPEWGRRLDPGMKALAEIELRRKVQGMRQPIDAVGVYY